MTLQELKESLTPEETSALKAASEKKDNITPDDAETLRQYIVRAAEALGEDQIAEPFRYITASVGGLRAADLTALIGEEDFQATLFADFNNALGFPLLIEQHLPTGDMLYTMHPQMRTSLQQLLGIPAMKSCAADIGYYLLERLPEGDIVRNTQALILLYVAQEPAAAAQYLSQASGSALQSAVMTTGNLIKTAPDAIQETIWQMLAAEGPKVDHRRLVSLMLNDVVAIIAQPDLVLPYLTRLHDTLQQMLPSHPEVTTYYGLAKLRIAQTYRLQRNEKEAQQWFGQGMNFVIARLKAVDAARLTLPIAAEYWNALKICQDMAQPKGMDVLFNELVALERNAIIAGTPDDTPNHADSSRQELVEMMLSQYIDISKSWLAMPKQLQEQLTDHTDTTIALLQDHLKSLAGDTAAPPADIRMANYYQILGELCHAKGREDESYEALTEAQIQQMRLLAIHQREDADGTMSQGQLMARLALSVTNHMLAGHYRRQGRGQHDLGIVLQNNLDLATGSYQYYPRDGRVIHFLINAALELGDMQHKSRGYLAECGTYEGVLRMLQPHLGSMRLDQQLAADVAMLLTKTGQVQADSAIRRYKDARNHLETARQLWTSLAQNTHNPTFQQNAEAVAKLIKSLGK